MKLVTALCVGLVGLAVTSVRCTAQSESPTAVWCENGHYYRAVALPQPVSWSEARLIAEAEGGYLATITSVAENQFVFSLINDQAFWRTNVGGSVNLGPWIGGTQSETGSEPSGGWGWTTGEPFSFSSWVSGRPDDNAPGGHLGCLDENRVHFWSSGATNRTATWNDIVDDVALCTTNADSIHAFVIEFDRAPQGVGCAPGWINLVTESAPPFTQVGMMTYDSTRQRTVWFGGGDNCTDSGETWEWDGATWTRVATTGPAPRRAGKMVFDSVRNVSLLFGGVGCFPTHYNDLWAWNGVTWTMLADSGPPTRREHAMSFDSVRGVATVFGGIGANFPILGDTWEWNGITWNQVATAGPSRRVKAAMCFDPITNTTVLFGGQLSAAGTSSGETWSWNGVNWTLRSTQGPSARWGSELVFDIRRRELVLIAGTDAQAVFFGEAWNLNTSGWSLINTSRCLTPRYQFGAVFDPVESSFVVFGGVGSNGSPVSRETWRLGSFEQDGICDCIDFNRNGVFPEDQDVIDFFLVLAGAECPSQPLPTTPCDIDFNNNEVFPEDEDVIAFFRVLAGGACQ